MLFLLHSEEASSWLAAAERGGQAQVLVWPWPGWWTGAILNTEATGVMWENLFLLDLDELQRGWSLESGAVWGSNTGSTLSHTDLFCVVVYWRFGSFGHNTFKSHFRNSKSLLYRWLTYIDTQCILNGALSLDKKGIKGPNSNHRLTGLHVVQKVHS